MSHTHTHDHQHGHDHSASEENQHSEKDPAEQIELAQHLGEEISELFIRYVQGDLDFAELTFSTYDMLQDLHIIALGEYELEYDEDGIEDAESDAGDISSDYTAESATEQQEDLAQEPART